MRTNEQNVIMQLADIGCDDKKSRLAKIAAIGSMMGPAGCRAKDEGAVRDALFEATFFDRGAESSTVAYSIPTGESAISLTTVATKDAFDGFQKRLDERSERLGIGPISHAGLPGLPFGLLIDADRRVVGAYSVATWAAVSIVGVTVLAFSKQEDDPSCGSLARSIEAAGSAFADSCQKHRSSKVEEKGSESLAGSVAEMVADIQARLFVAFGSLYGHRPVPSSAPIREAVLNTYSAVPASILQVVASDLDAGRAWDRLYAVLATSSARDALFTFARECFSAEKAIGERAVEVWKAAVDIAADYSSRGEEHRAVVSALNSMFEAIRALRSVKGKGGGDEGAKPEAESKGGREGSD